MAQNRVIVITALQHIARQPTVHHLIAHQVIIAHQLTVLQLILPPITHLLITYPVIIVLQFIIFLLTLSLFIKQLITGNS